MSERAESTLSQKIKRLHGPILVLGASGFVGAALLRTLARERDDVYGTASRLPAWRLDGLPAHRILAGDLLIDSHLDQVVQTTRPRTVFDCIAYGAYSFETDSTLIYQTNFNLAIRLLDRLDRATLACYVHAGSSSEYGDNAAGPDEGALPAPNSDYAVSKVAVANLLLYHGKKKGLPCVNLRLYSVYGPLEDSSRLIPNLVRRGVEGQYPEFVDPEVSRDFLFVDDACEAFVDAALNLREDDYGNSFNIGTGARTTIGGLASLSRAVFDIHEAPRFTMPSRTWDVANWYANIERARTRLGWQPRTSLREGLEKTAEWYRALTDKNGYERSSKRYGLDTRHSVSAVVACLGEGDRVDEAYHRLKAVFASLNVDHEVVFVDDGDSPAIEEAVRVLSRNDRRVIGIGHSRGFGKQAAFRSGMEAASKNSCVLLTASLDDPPELIEQFVARWREGYDVVYGIRDREPDRPTLAIARRILHQVFNTFSYVAMPRDAGEFCLMDTQAVRAMLRFPERDLFLPGVRAFAGFKQTGVPYRPSARAVSPRSERLSQKLRRAKHGVLSFSNAPLTILSLSGLGLLVLSILLGLVQMTVRILYPERSVSGITTVLLVVLFFGAVNAFAIGLVGEYVGRIFEEVKRRPHFIRRTFIKDGEVRRAADELTSGEG
ncbi:MAG: NAD-dependent epimerase/dehydratase family protein [Isosphaeraceae bacterium]|nr:NAD-dependent epimerase/dehydratase family protein [Isosphaeraceae bacterium]